MIKPFPEIRMILVLSARVLLGKLIWMEEASAPDAGKSSCGSKSHC